ncbi:MAG: methyltransferase [Planctomycetota bacterium]
MSTPAPRATPPGLLTALKLRAQRMLTACGYEVHRQRAHRATIRGLRYRADPCSVGCLPETELAATSAVQMLEAWPRSRSELAVLDLCCGIGAIGLSLFAEHGGARVRDVAFADINIFNLTSVERAVRDNGFADDWGTRLRHYLSDGLDQVPRDRLFDLVVCNPPHFPAAGDAPINTPARLASHDPSGRLQPTILSRCHQYLAPGGEIWLLQNREAGNPQWLLGLADQNAHLEPARAVRTAAGQPFYWLVARRQ